MNKRVTCLLCALLATASAAQLGASMPGTRSCANLTRSHQPQGKPTPASSFAPHPGRAGHHVYGAPIQKPILKMQPRKPTPAAPKMS